MSAGGKNEEWMDRSSKHAWRWRKFKIKSAINILTASYRSGCLWIGPKWIFVSNIYTENWFEGKASNTNTKDRWQQLFFSSTTLVF
jgi:hypothetical protein